MIGCQDRCKTHWSSHVAHSLTRVPWGIERVWSTKPGKEREVGVRRRSTRVALFWRWHIMTNYVSSNHISIYIHFLTRFSNFHIILFWVMKLTLRLWWLCNRAHWWHISSASLMKTSSCACFGSSYNTRVPLNPHPKCSLNQMDHPCYLFFIYKTIWHYHPCYVRWFISIGMWNKSIFTLNNMFFCSPHQHVLQLFDETYITYTATLRLIKKNKTSEVSFVKSTVAYIYCV